MTPSEPTNPEARAYLEGFDDHAGIVDQPTEHDPQDIVITTTQEGSRLVVEPGTVGGGLVRVYDVRPKAHPRTIELDRNNARALSDALQWAAHISR